MPLQHSLFELNKKIQGTIKNAFTESIWVIGEISELNINRNGHCYLELVEKDELTEKIIAKARATIWAFTFRLLKPYFENTTGRAFSSGIKVLINASVEFHELYGYSLNISDIDPNYTLGDLARKKAEILSQLEEDGVIEMNKDLPVPIVPQKIAIISSPTAAGYQDFLDQLKNNLFGYNFYTKLFPAIMQGEDAEESIIHSLERIYNYENFFDIVVIVRGGGSQTDLACFDNYNLALNIAQFPIPVFTGIGHDKDESIIDIIAHTKLKTPTAVAEHIVNLVNNFEESLLELESEITNLSQRIIQANKEKLSNIIARIKPLTISKLNSEKHKLIIAKKEISSETKQYLLKHKASINSIYKKLANSSQDKINAKANKIKFLSHNLKLNSKIFTNTQYKRLELLDTKIKFLDPSNILKRGYSITYCKNKIVKSSQEISEGDIIYTKLAQGKIKSRIENS